MVTVGSPQNVENPLGVAGPRARRKRAPLGVTAETAMEAEAVVAKVTVATEPALKTRTAAMLVGAIVAIVAVGAAGQLAVWAIVATVVGALAFTVLLCKRPRERTIRIVDQELRFDGVDQAFDQPTQTIPLADVESICVEAGREGSGPSLVVQTSGTPVRFGSGLSESTLQWIRNHLAAEIADRSWGPTPSTEPRRQMAKPPVITNPVMLKPDLALKLIKIFLNESPSRIVDLRRAVEAKDFAAVQTQAHWLKTASANVGALHMSELCLLTEQFARDRQMAHGRILCDEIDRKFEKMKAWLDDLRITAADRLSHIPSDAFMETATSFALHVNPTSIDMPTPPDAATQKPLSARVLVVDDCAISREIAFEFLSCLVREVVMAPNGESALSEWRAGGVDAIFMDCELAGMNGYEITRAIRAEETVQSLPRVPIIAMTGNVGVEDEAACSHAGMNDYLAKPYTLEALEDVLHRWIGDLRQPTQLTDERRAESAQGMVEAA